MVWLFLTNPKHKNQPTLLCHLATLSNFGLLLTSRACVDSRFLARTPSKPQNSSSADSARRLCEPCRKNGQIKRLTTRHSLILFNIGIWVMWLNDTIYDFPVLEQKFYVFFEKLFRLPVEPVGEWLWVGHAQGVHVREPVVPQRPRHVWEGDDALDGLLEDRPRRRKVNPLRLERHRDGEGGGGGEGEGQRWGRREIVNESGKSKTNI